MYVPEPHRGEKWKVTYQFCGTSHKNLLSESTTVANPFAGNNPITRFPVESNPENSIPNMHCCKVQFPGEKKKLNGPLKLFLQNAVYQIVIKDNWLAQISDYFAHLDISICDWASSVTHQSITYGRLLYLISNWIWNPFYLVHFYSIQPFLQGV